MGLQVIIQPDVEPLTLDEAKEWASVPLTVDDHDNVFLRLIKAARFRAERHTKRALITQTVVATMDYFPLWIEIPKPPLQSVITLSYLDADGSSSVLYDSGSPLVGAADYVIDTYSNPARMLRAYGIYWPEPIVQANAVQLTFVAGYGDKAEDVPEDIRLAMGMMINHWFEHRESVSEERNLTVVPQSALWILDDYRVLSVA